MLVPNGAEQLQAYAKRTFEKNILKVAEHIYYFTGFGHSNATLLIGDTSCILVDVLDSDVRGETLKQAIAQITDKPVKTIIYTDIAKDGMLCGPNVGQTARLVETTGLNIVASGGVSCMEDLEQLESIGVEGAILGKAIYEKKVDLKGAVARFC